MANTSERIIILSAVLLVGILVRSNQLYQIESINDKEVELIGEQDDTILTWKDMQIQIATSRDNYTLGERFTATVYLVNNRSEEVRMKPVYSITIVGGVNRSDGIGRFTSWTYPADTIITLPPNSKKKLDEATFTPKKTGLFIIESMGIEKSVLILEQDIAWIKAFILTREPSSNLNRVKLSSEDENVPRSLFEAIDKVLPDDESVADGVIRDSTGVVHLFGISIAEADSIIHYFGEEIEVGRDTYEFYVSFVDYVFSIYIQFSRPLVTS